MGLRNLQVTDGERVAAVPHGIPMLTRITASGCAVTALVAAYVSCAPEQPLEATAHALAYFGYVVEEEHTCCPTLCT